MFNKKTKIEWRMVNNEFNVNNKMDWLKKNLMSKNYLNSRIFLPESLF